jgi:glycine/D-amino acid oxidase-like deaminating enzyme
MTPPAPGIERKGAGMQDQWDVVIVGGAVSGASTAWWLKGMQPDLRVLVVEMDPTYAKSATALSAASIRSQFSNPVNVNMSRFGIDFVRNFADYLGPDGGVPDLGLRETGYLFLTRTETGAALLEELAAMQRELGADTHVLSPAEISGRFPWMNVGDLAAGSFGTRDEGSFDNMGLVTGFRNAARARGAVFVKDRAIGLEREGDRIVAVQLEQNGRMATGAVVSAAGTRSAQVCGWAGLSLPVEPRKRTVFIIDAPGARHPDAPLIIDPSGIYMRPENNQWLTATVPTIDGPCDADDFEPNAHEFEDEIWEKLYERAEGFGAAKVTRLWAGHYDYNTLDQNAVIGLWPGMANFYVAAGFSGHGLQQSPAVGRGLAELITTGAYQTLDLSDLGVERVLEGRPFLEQAIV